MPVCGCCAHHPWRSEPSHIVRLDLAEDGRVRLHRDAPLLFWTVRRLLIVSYFHANGRDLNDDRVVVAKDSSCELRGVREIGGGLSTAFRSRSCGTPSS